MTADEQTELAMIQRIPPSNPTHAVEQCEVLRILWETHDLFDVEGLHHCPCTSYVMIQVDVELCFGANENPKVSIYRCTLLRRRLHDAAPLPVAKQCRQ